MILVEKPDARTDAVSQLIKTSDQTVWIILSIFGEIVKYNPVFECPVLQIQVGKA